MSWRKISMKFEGTSMVCNEKINIKNKEWKIYN